MNRTTIVLGIGSLLLLACPIVATAAAAKGTYNHDMSAYTDLTKAAMGLVKDGKMADAFAKTQNWRRRGTRTPRT